MYQFRLLIISGLFLMIIYAVTHYVEIAQAQSRHQIKDHGLLKEEVLFDNGNMKVFRTFDKMGKQVFNQDVTN